jgi:hypothetical protein
LFQFFKAGHRTFTTCAALALALSAGAAHATTYYVSTSGSDSNGGTQSAPFRHISRGASVAQAGDTVMVMDGSYDNEGQVADPNSLGAVVTVRNSGAPGSPITIMAQNRGRAILDAASGTQSSFGCYAAWSYFDLSYTSYVVIQGFVIQNGCLQAIHANGNAHDITIRWNEIRNIGNWNNSAGTGSPTGIYVNKNEYNFTFDGNTFHDIGGGANVNQQHAIYSSGSNITIVNNVFYNQMHGFDVHLAGGSNVYISNNTFAFANPNRDGHIVLWDDDIPNSLNHIVIQNNVFYQPRNTAIIPALAGGSVGSCSISNNLSTGGSLYDGGDCLLDRNLTNIDPAFANLPGYDFHLVGGSPAIDSGANNGYTSVDMDNGGRPTNGAYDMGAFEYQSTGATGTYTAPAPAPAPPPSNTGSTSSGVYVSPFWPFF